MLVFNENDANNYNQCVCAQTPLRSINGRRIFPFNKGLRIYGGVYYPSFDTLKIHTSTYDTKLYRLDKISFSRIALNNFWDHVVDSAS